MKTWRLDGPSTTLVMASGGGIPCVVYWGLSIAKNEDLLALVDTHSIDISGGAMDVVAPISLCPEGLNGFMGQVGACIRDVRGTGFKNSFSLTTDQSTKNRLTFDCENETVKLIFDIKLQGDLLCLKTQFESTEPHFVEWLAAPVLPLPSSISNTVEFSGKWCNEFQEVMNPITPGARMRNASGGRPGHENFPGLIAVGNNIAYGFHFASSGGHKMISEELPDGRRQVMFGNAAQSNVIPSNTVSSATLYASCAKDQNSLAQIFQHGLRQLDEKPKKTRPVHYNSWEAVYFDHDLDVLKDIANNAAALGAERFVLDDGWFEGRNDDTSSLGDWWLDAAKYPDGLAPLIDHITSLGMGFGIWFEPEMVNKDSILYRSHPDWILGEVDQAEGRGQLVLDLSKQQVQDYLFEKIDSVLSSNEIEYVKWDHNRMQPVSSNGSIHAAKLADRLKAAHPNVDFETCASGGARIAWDFLSGAFNRVWLSDSNDAFERWKMQRSAARFLPNEYVGSHVGPRECHTSGRILPMAFRAWVAASRHMGFEMDPRELSEEEATTLKDITSWYKENRDWMHAGVALSCPVDDPAVLAEIQVSTNANKFVVMAAQMEVSAQSAPRPIRFIGLKPDVKYRVSLRNPEDAARVTRGKVALRDAPLILSGSTLMQMGVQLPSAFPATMWVIEGQKV